MEKNMKNNYIYITESLCTVEIKLTNINNKQYN